MFVALLSIGRLPDDVGVPVNVPKVPFKFGVDSSGNYGYIKAGADTVTPFLTRTCNATAANVLSGKTFSNASSSGLTGTMPNIKDIDDAISSVYVANGSSGSGIYARMNAGAHITNAISGYPELFIPQSQIASTIGLTADKIVSGNKILGIWGSANAAVTSQNGSFYFSVNPNKTVTYQVKFNNNFADTNYRLTYTVTSGYYKDYITMSVNQKLASGFTLNVTSRNTGSNATGDISWIAEQ